MSDNTFGVVGYGSLVNLETLVDRPVRATPVRLSGWRRRWVPRPNMPGFPSSLLSVETHAATTITGMLLVKHHVHRSALDARERHYSPVAIAADCLMPFDLQSEQDLPPAIIYQADPVAPPNRPMPILQSYLDAVLEGFLVLGGEAAARDFCATTDGWDVGIHNDRDAPIYPRARHLDRSELARIDTILAPYR